MDHKKTMIMDKTRKKPLKNVVSYELQNNGCEITFANGKSYTYNQDRIEWLEDPNPMEVAEYSIKNKAGKTFINVDKILVFEGSQRYIRIFSSTGINDYQDTDLIIEKNILPYSSANLLFEYYKQVADVTGLKDNNGNNLLFNKYKELGFISPNTVLAKYFVPSELSQVDGLQEMVLFPFGCNLSQITAVRKALSNQISVIEGPPGTGKTQTILNIIANLVVREKTVAVVSNNNAATFNVLEKLNKSEYGYIVATLGNHENIKSFLENQPVYPDFKNDLLKATAYKSNQEEIASLEKNLVKSLEDKNKIATLKQILALFSLEERYFDDYFDSLSEDKSKVKRISQLMSKTILDLWAECHFMNLQGKQIGFWRKLKYSFKYHIDGFALFKDGVIEIIPQFKKAFYTVKLKEITDAIKHLEEKLKGFNFDDNLQKLSSLSVEMFKHALANKYVGKTRPYFNEKKLSEWGHDFLKEYPVVLSSTYSLSSSLKDTIYDYVIVDEASQVDLATGVLTMACAKNLVVVGDLKQLPNVITSEHREHIKKIFDQDKIATCYRMEEQCLLSSICAVFKDVPRTLLREHYRCHPKIIEFCNQKFYNGELIVMTKDQREDDVLGAYITAKGNHKRQDNFSSFNQRQIDVIKEEIMKDLQSEDLGIIAPYRAQTKKMDEQINVENHNDNISTVHKFQGRENDDIIISTVDNEIGDFVDDPKMLNVAVSRAKKRLRVIVSDNEKNENTNIGDLIKYIKYHNFEIKKSEIRSIFDQLNHELVEAIRLKLKARGLKPSKFNTENKMADLILDILESDDFSQLNFSMHQSLKELIVDLNGLNEAEKSFVNHPNTHLDFAIYRKIDKSIVLAIEVDGYCYHKLGTDQHKRDRMKDTILEKYNIPMIRFNTTESGEKEKLIAKLKEVLKTNHSNSNTITSAQLKT